jgi:hypothetical protein
MQHGVAAVVEAAAIEARRPAGAVASWRSRMATGSRLTGRERILRRQQAACAADGCLRPFALCSRKAPEMRLNHAARASS